AEPVEDQTPDVVQAPPDNFVPRAIRAEAGQLGLIELRDAARLVFDLGIVERALGQINPVTQPARKLVRKQVRILDAETCQQNLALVGSDIVVSVFEQEKIAP